MMNIEELCRQVNETSDDRVKNDIYLSISELYLKKSCFEDCRAYAERAKEFAFLNDDNDLLYKSNSIIGMSYCVQGDPIKAKEVFMYNLKIANFENCFLRKIKSFLNLGNADYNLHNFESSLYFYNKALELSEKFEYKDYLAKILNNIANVYIDLKKYNEARKYLKLSLFEKLKSDNKSDVANTLLNFGNLYKVKGDYPLAAGYYKRAMKIFRELNINNYYALCLKSMASIYKHKEDYKTAIDYYLKALDICIEFKVNAYIYVIYLFLAETYCLDKNYDESEKYYKLLLENFSGIQNIKHRLIFLRDYAEFNKKTGNLEKALDFMNQYVKLNNKIYNDSIVQNTGKIIQAVEKNDLIVENDDKHFLKDMFLHDIKNYLGSLNTILDLLGKRHSVLIVDEDYNRLKKISRKALDLSEKINQNQ